MKADIGGALVSLDMFNSPAMPPPAAGEAAELHFAASDWVVLKD